MGEGRSDEVIARKLIVSAGCQPGRSYLRPFSGTGKANLDQRLAGLNRGAAFGRPVLALRDLDHDAPCASALVARLLPERDPACLLRIAVREVEVWLLADRDAYAAFCGVGVGRVPSAPEALDDPKRTILALADAGTSTRLARHLAAGRQRRLAVWQSLGEWHSRFAEEVWQPLRAIGYGSAPSLRTAHKRLSALASGADPAGSARTSRKP